MADRCRRHGWFAYHVWNISGNGHFVASLNIGRSEAIQAAYREGRQLAAHPPAKTVLDAAATLIGLGTSEDHAAVRQRRLCVGLIQEAQDRSGGWGPFVISAPEPFDTAVVLLGLSQLGDDAKRRQMIQRGRRYLMEGQFDDGSWPETTRPANAESYAQRIATTGWATLALLATMTQESHQQTRKPASQ